VEVSRQTARATDGRYPEQWEADVVLRDGTTTHVRPIRAEDAEALQRFQMQQSEQSSYFRFFAPVSKLTDRELDFFTNVDYGDRVALVAVRPNTKADDPLSAEDVIGVARYDIVAPGQANVAFNVADPMHGLGLGSVLLEHLAAAARERGVFRFTAEVLPDNLAMLAVFRDAGFRVSQAEEDGIITLAVELDPTERSRAVMGQREQQAESRSMQALLSARRVLLVGPGEQGIDPEDEDVAQLSGHDRDQTAARISAVRLARRVIANHVKDPGDTELFVLDPPPARPGEPVLPDAPLLHLVKSWDDVPPVDLLLLAIPANECIDAVQRLVDTGARGVVVLSVGFGETGEEGKRYLHDLVRITHALGMRLVGPASYGLITNNSDHRLRASLALEPLKPGPIGVFCQSAPAAFMLTSMFAKQDLGISTMVSGGHRADVSGNSALQYWLTDDDTKVACLYLESIGNPRKFARVAKRLSQEKPIVTFGAGLANYVLPPGHPVRESNNDRALLDQLLRRSGVIIASDTQELVNIAQLLAYQPLPKGRRVGILATSPTLGAVVAERAEASGLDVVRPHSFMAMERTREDIRDAIESVFQPDSCDAVIVVDVPIVEPASPDVGTQVVAASARTGIPTVAAMMGPNGTVGSLIGEVDGEERRVPAFATPEDAVAALTKVVEYAAWRERGHGVLVHPSGIDRPGARRIVDQALQGHYGSHHPNGVELDQITTSKLLACYGLRLWPARLAHDVGQAISDAESLGWPVAIKSADAMLRHRVDLGGVRLDVVNASQLREVVTRLRAAAATIGADSGFMVQKMAPPGVACIVRSHEDPLFGPVVSFGIAGDASALLGDVANAVPPLTDVDVHEMITGLKAAPRLFEHSGLPSVDIDALADVIARVSVMADDIPELAGLELYPVVVAEHGAILLEAQVRLRAADERRDPLRRVLPI